MGRGQIQFWAGAGGVSEAVRMGVGEVTGGVRTREGGVVADGRGGGWRGGEPGEGGRRVGWRGVCGEVRRGGGGWRGGGGGGGGREGEGAVDRKSGWQGG